MKPNRLLAMGAAVLTAAAVLVGFEIAEPATDARAASSVDAVTGAGFDPGNIIDDALFYNGAALSAGDVQSFLVSKGGAISRMTLRTPSMSAASGLCGAYSGSDSERVADVIAKVGAACGISQKVLLVLLQKEQHLVSATNPSQWTMDHATGFACPDTAPCDPAFAGFFYQVWYAARQFKRYALTPNSYNHLAGRVNNVRFHPNAACGTSPIFIENVATAGLYNYTPYQPDSGALANIYGLGGTCSSYGNRNFWSIYTDWFGSTTSNSQIATYHATSGGNGGPLGRPGSGVEHFSGAGGGLGQRFDNGSIMSSPTAGTWAIMNGPLRDEYWSKGGPSGAYGWPTGAQVCSSSASCTQPFQGGAIASVIGALHVSMGGDSGPLGRVTGPVENFAASGGGIGQRFQNGSIMSSPTAGTWAILNGLIRDEYWAQGGPAGALGWPTAQQTCSGGVCSQTFVGGTIIDLKAAAAAAIAALHTSLGGAAGTLGASQADIERFTGSGGGYGRRFLNGSIMTSPAAGTWAIVNGPIRDEYWARGGPSGSLGWPTGAQTCTGGSCSQTFQGGTVSDRIAALHTSLGGDRGPLGPAASGIEVFAGSGGGTGQRFRNGSIMSSPTAGTFAIMNGPIRDAYWGRGGPAGDLGWPTGAQGCSAGVCSQAFQGGTISDQIAGVHAALGGDSGVLGPAQAAVETFAGSGGGTGQRFRNGSIMSSPTAGTWAIMNGPIRDQYWATGGPAGTLGWPTAARACTSAGCSQSFQGGTLTQP